MVEHGSNQRKMKREFFAKGSIDAILNNLKSHIFAEFQYFLRIFIIFSSNYFHTLQYLNLWKKIMKKILLFQKLTPNWFNDSHIYRL